MSSITVEEFSKHDYQNLVSSNDPSISLLKPVNARSDLWSSFCQLYYLNIAQNYIVCNGCRNVLKWTSETGTKVMKNHNCAKKLIPKPSTTPSHQRTISSYMSSAQENYSTIKDHIVEAYVEFCTLDSKPFETANGEGFINLAKQLMNAGALIGTGFSVKDLLPHPTTISRSVERIYNKFKDQLVLLCENVDNFAITCDFWTASLTGLHYGGVGLYFVDVNFNLRMFILACKLYDLPNQKAFNIRDFVNIIVEEFSLKINNDIFIVSDNEPKMLYAFKEDATRVGCSAHYINKIIQHAFELEESLCTGVQTLFLIVRDIISSIRQSHKQSFLSVCVQNYCKTRFSSVYIMLNTFLMVYNELPCILNSTQRQNYLKVSYSELKKLTKYLKNFHDVIEKLSCEHTPTIHLVIPYKQLLIKRSNKTDDDHQDLIQLKRFLSKHLNDYWIIHDIHYIGMLLHPNLKSFQLMPDKKKHAVALLKSEVDKLIDPIAMQPVQSTMTNNKEKNAMHSANSLDEIFDVPDDENHIQQLIEKTELDRYLEDETKIDNGMNVLIYWHLNKSLYPNLARVAKRILAIPATNTSIERLFSNSGNTVTDRRTRLDADKVNNLLFIKQNMRTLKEMYSSVIEVCRKRKNYLITSDSTSSPTRNKKIKLTTANQDMDEETTDEDNDNEQF